MYDSDPKTHSQANFIPKISTAELRDRFLETLPFDTILLDLLDSARLVTRLQIINGNRPELLEPALEGEHVGDDYLCGMTSCVGAQELRPGEATSPLQPPYFKTEGKDTKPSLHSPRRASRAVFKNNSLIRKLVADFVCTLKILVFPSGSTFGYQPFNCLRCETGLLQAGLFLIV